MKEIKDDKFGKITYDHYWCKNYSIPFLGKERDVVLVIDGDEDADFEESQYIAFDEFNLHKESIVREVESAVFKHYMSVCGENRQRFGEQADELSPEISSSLELEKIVKLKQVVVMESFDLDDRKIGFLFDALWEPELGVGVIVTNGSVFEVGTQDIVL